MPDIEVGAHIQADVEFMSRHEEVIPSEPIALPPKFSIVDAVMWAMCASDRSLDYIAKVIADTIACRKTSEKKLGTTFDARREKMRQDEVTRRQALSPEDAHAEHWQEITKHAEAAMQNSGLIMWAREFVEAVGEYEKAKECTKAAAAYEKAVEAAMADGDANGDKGHTGPMGRAAMLRPASTDPQNTDDALNEESRAANRLILLRLR